MSDQNGDRDTLGHADGLLQLGELSGPLRAVQVVARHLIPLSIYWGASDSHEYRKRLAAIEEHIHALRITDGDLDRRLKALEEAAYHHGRLPDSIKRHDIRVAFAAVHEAAVADEHEKLQACANFAASALAGRVGDQASVAALAALPNVTVDGLAFLRNLVLLPDAARSTMLEPDIDFGVLDGVAALGLVQRLPGIEYEGRVTVRITRVGIKLVRHTARSDSA